MNPMNILESLDKRGQLFWVIAGLVLVAGIATIDVVTGPEISFSFFYLIPIVLVVWFAGRWLGCALAVGSAVAWFIADDVSGQTYSNAWIGYWNAFVRLGFFVVVALLLPALKALEREKHLARIDYLTGAANRRLFSESMQREIERSRRYKRPFTIALLDVDDFKLVNDRLGHATGDQVLRAVVTAVKNSLRQSDIVARLGGDEFAFLLPETSEAAAQIAIAKVRTALSDDMRRNGWHVTFSIGAVTCVETQQTSDELLQRVDTLMYAVKNRGKNALEYEVCPT